MDNETFVFDQNEVYYNDNDVLYEKTPCDFGYYLTKPSPVEWVLFYRNPRYNATMPEYGPAILSIQLQEFIYNKLFQLIYNHNNYSFPFRQNPNEFPLLQTLLQYIQPNNRYY